MHKYDLINYIKNRICLRMQVTPEQSAEIQKICFEHGIFWSDVDLDETVDGALPEPENIYYDHLFIEPYLGSIDAATHAAETSDRIVLRGCEDPNLEEYTYEGHKLVVVTPDFNGWDDDTTDLILKWYIPDDS